MTTLTKRMRRQRNSMPTLHVVAIALIAAHTTTMLPTVSAFHIPSILEPLASVSSSLSHQLPHNLEKAATTFTTASTISTAATTPSFVFHPFQLYLNTLAQHPLPTKMLTGATLATTGDFIAQTTAGLSQDDYHYDKKRASSFALFDAAYRASQHVLYPLVVATCQGQYLSQALPNILPTATSAAMEQTLVSQLIIVPLLYYPVFYGVTSFVQGLTATQTVERAKQTFAPLMKRNLLFWIPCQFIQFSYVPDELQIPFLSVCGLCWTLILSLMAGSATQHASNEEEGENDSETATTTTATTTAMETTITNKNDTEDDDSEPYTHYSAEEPYCVTGLEEGCYIDQDEIFPHTNMEDLGHEMQDLSQEVTQEMQDMATEVAEEFQHWIEDLGVQRVDNSESNADMDDCSDDDATTSLKPTKKAEKQTEEEEMAAWRRK